MKNKIIKLIIILTIALIAIDQISKVIVKYNYQVPIEKGFIEINVVENTGIAFGINSGNTKNMVLTSIILLIILNFVKNQIELIDKKNAIAISFILAGGISNLIDRIIRNGVMDFIKIKHFSIFNIADCYIVIGWILLILFLIKFNKNIVGEKKCEKQ